jgi:hypothetical protein
MPANPEVLFQFHDTITEVINKWRLEPNKGQVYLVYGLNPMPWAELRCQVYRIAIPIPARPTPYGSWRDWMSGYLEDQVALVAEETKENILVMTNKGKLVPLTRKDPEEFEQC